MSGEVPESDASVRFAAKYPWAIIPDRPVPDRRPSEPPEGWSRWLRADRTHHRCRPSSLGERLGWMVRSPIDVEMSPVEQVEVGAEPDELGGLAAALPGHELWRRETSYLAIAKGSWIGLHQAQFDGGWEAMFVPNGEGTLEWHLGWTVEIPPTHAMLVMPDPRAAVLALLGVLDAPTIERVGRLRGMSVAIRPRPASIRRGDPIARIVLLHPDSWRRDGPIGGDGRTIGEATTSLSSPEG